MAIVSSFEPNQFTGSINRISVLANKRLYFGDFVSARFHGEIYFTAHE
jgi:hypothetical protein